MKKALIVVDCQKDFCEGGSLQVMGGNEVCKKIAEGPMLDADYAIVVLSKDDHIYGSDNGGHISATPDFHGSWPAHCVQGTDGNKLNDHISRAFNINRDRAFMVFKGQGKPAYSVFEGFDVHGTTTDQLLKRHGITDVVIVGLATDHCVKATAIDSKLRGYATEVQLDLTAAVSDATAKEAIDLMREKGVYIP